MKSHIIWILGLLGILGAIIFSCQKIDIQKTNSSRNEERFFNTHKSSNPLVIAVSNYMKNENSKSPFVEKVVNQLGFPFWDKAKIFSNPAPARNTTLDSSNIIYVPFARDSQNFINAALIIKTTGTDTTFKYLCDWQYQEHQFSELQDTSITAREVFNFFATFDRDVFGRTMFRLTDKRLYSHADSMEIISRGIDFDSSYVYVRFINNGRMSSGRNNLYEMHEICNDFESCIPLQLLGFRSNRTTEECPSGYLLQYTICTQYWVEVPGGGGGSGSGSGSGSGNNPPGCGGVLARTSLQEGCSSGWTGVGGSTGGSPPSPPTDTTAANLLRLITKFKTTIDSLHNMAQQDGDERTYTLARAPNGDTVLVFPKSGNSHSSSPTLTISAFGMGHSHQDDGTPGGDKNQSFDAGDLYKFYKNVIIDQYSLNVSIISTRDYYYAAVIIDPILYGNYTKNLCSNPKDIKVLAKNLNDLHINAWDACIGCSWQVGSEAGTLAVTANNDASVSGIKIYRSPKSHMNFTLLTH